MRRSLLLVTLLPFFLSACTEAAIGALDEKMSQWTEQECSTVFLALGDGYCRDRIKPGSRRGEKLHCFRTLGGVDCYTTADPYDVNGTGRTRQAQRLTDPSPQDSASANVEPAP